MPYSGYLQLHTNICCVDRSCEEGVGICLPTVTMQWSPKPTAIVQCYNIINNNNNNNKVIHSRPTLAIGGIAAKWEFRPQIFPSRGYRNPLSNTMLLGTTRVYIIIFYLPGLYRYTRGLKAKGKNVETAGMTRGPCVASDKAVAK